MSKRNLAQTKGFTFGTCSYQRTSPPQDKLSPNTKVLNIYLCFEDALKLNLAIDECVRQLNSYKRSTTAGKKAAVNLTIHLEKGRITVNQGRLSGKGEEVPVE